MESEEASPREWCVSWEWRGVFLGRRREFLSEGACVKFGTRRMVRPESLAFGPLGKQWERREELAEVP